MTSTSNEFIYRTFQLIFDRLLGLGNPGRTVQVHNEGQLGTQPKYSAAHTYKRRMAIHMKRLIPTLNTITIYFRQKPCRDIFLGLVNALVEKGSKGAHYYFFYPQKINMCSFFIAESSQNLIKLCFLQQFD